MRTYQTTSTKVLGRSMDLKPPDGVQLRVSAEVQKVLSRRHVEIELLGGAGLRSMLCRVMVRPAPPEMLTIVTVMAGASSRDEWGVAQRPEDNASAGTVSV